MTEELLTANHAAAVAATLAGRANRAGRGFGGGIYPITPQTEAIEYLCRQSFEKGAVVRVESEHSAMATCIGFSVAGARAFTASSANGLAYMTENVYVAAAYRLPVVMMAVNRALGPPWNIWVDHGDTLALRDMGWLQLYCADNQEVLDTVLCAFRLAEDRRVLLPVMVCQDGFVLSHTMAAVDVPEQSAVDAFLPILDLPHRVTAEPRSVGQLDPPHAFEVHRRQLSEAMARVPEIYREVQHSFASCFGRSLPDPVVGYRLDDADLVLVSMGTTAASAEVAVDQARARGLRAGSVRVRMFRPFPEVALGQALGRAAKVGVVDRNLCPGLGGILWAEARALCPHGALVQGYVAGLGGGDIRPEHLCGVIDDLAGRQQAEAPVFVEVG
jgi:pyruvate/2-oxoacid:ferredoxin oxidoreductase alpha subunit